MEELIQSISARLGVADETVRKAVKVLLKFARKQMKAADFEKLLAQLPGAAELLAEPSETTASPGGGLFGGLSSLLGGQAGEAAAAFADLKATGLSGPQITSFLQVFIAKAREIAGSETVDAILKEIPFLQTFLKSGA
jgi:hypothetical protein